VIKAARQQGSKAATANKFGNGSGVHGDLGINNNANK